MWCWWLRSWVYLPKRLHAGQSPYFCTMSLSPFGLSNILGTLSSLLAYTWYSKYEFFLNFLCREGAVCFLFGPYLVMLLGYSWQSWWDDRDQTRVGQLQDNRPIHCTVGASPQDLFFCLSALYYLVWKKSGSDRNSIFLLPGSAEWFLVVAVVWFLGFFCLYREEKQVCKGVLDERVTGNL